MCDQWGDWRYFRLKALFRYRPRYLLVIFAWIAQCQAEILSLLPSVKIYVGIQELPLARCQDLRGDLGTSSIFTELINIIMCCVVVDRYEQSRRVEVW